MDTPVLDFWWCLPWVLKVDPLTCILHCLCTTESSDSPLVGHLLTCWQPSWQPSHSHPQALVGPRTRIYHACGCLTLWNQTDALPTELCQLSCNKEASRLYAELLSHADDVRTTSIIRQWNLARNLALVSSAHRPHEISTPKIFPVK